MASKKQPDVMKTLRTLVDVINVAQMRSSDDLFGVWHNTAMDAIRDAEKILANAGKAE